ncbi:MAG: hypothetical protein NT154_38320 [Verrucomicrobia bacterium]|nr:hypothetical protein [Verrucomicrobiota bacterium]
MKYTVVPADVEGCECDECRSGRHLYFLYRCSELETGGWSGVTLHTYASAQECKENHYWGIRFNPDDTWEDGSPIVQPDPLEGLRCGGHHSNPRAIVPLNVEVLQKSAAMLEKHWLPPDSTE